MKTRNIAIAAVAASLLCSCGSHQEYKCVTPLPADVSPEMLLDCTLPASFKPEDFDWDGYTLKLTVCSKDVYDAEEVAQLQAGDTLIYCGEPIVIDALAAVEGGIEINGGQIDEGGCFLVPNGGGTFVARHWDNHATYTEALKAVMTLAEHCVIIDCGEMPTDPCDTIRTDLKTYVENLKDSRPNFSPLNTLVTIRNGSITEISRRWIP
ncbi:MAG: hypothetical protein HUJ91_00250 [Bacteroidales bacterium]|nr:hypothetical protein [Bacteroidales bacterium]